jgi:hypothetical protein
MWQDFNKKCWRKLSLKYHPDKGGDVTTQTDLNNCADKKELRRPPLAKDKNALSSTSSKSSKVVKGGAAARGTCSSDLRPLNILFFCATIALGVPSEMYASAWSYAQTFVLIGVAYFNDVFSSIWGNFEDVFRWIWPNKVSNSSEAATAAAKAKKIAVGLCTARQLWKHGPAAASDVWFAFKNLFGVADLETMERLCGKENGQKLYKEINDFEGQTFEQKFEKYRQEQLDKFRAESPLHRKEFIGAIVVLATATLYCLANDVSYLSELPFAFAFAGMLIYRVVEDEIDDAFQRFVCETP